LDFLKKSNFWLLWGCYCGGLEVRLLKEVELLGVIGEGLEVGLLKEVQLLAA